MHGNVRRVHETSPSHQDQQVSLRIATRVCRARPRRTINSINVYACRVTSSPVLIQVNLAGIPIHSQERQCPSRPHARRYHVILSRSHGTAGIAAPHAAVRALDDRLIDDLAAITQRGAAAGRRRTMPAGHRTPTPACPAGRPGRAVGHCAGRSRAPRSRWCARPATSSWRLC